MSDKEEIKKPKNSLQSLNCAIEGILYAFKMEKHIKYHYLIAVAALVISLILGLPPLEFALLAVSVVVLLFAEMVNTAVEEVVNLLEDKHNIIAGNAKDLIAGAAVVASAAVVIVTFMIFTKYVYSPAAASLFHVQEKTAHMAFISLVLVLISVIVIKALVTRTRPLHKGPPSGHAAIAFSLWVSVSFISQNFLIILLAFIMAALVSQSRMLKGIHSWTDVISGVVVGAGITFIVFYVFSFWIVKTVS
ncbi:MAG: diacylglycerol kinase [Thermodesulfobacteriota bacterium]